MSKLTLLAAAWLLAAATAPAQTAYVDAAFHDGDFKLVAAGGAATIWVAAEDYQVAKLAAGDLAKDVERVTGVRAAVRSAAAGLGPHAVLIGTLGHSPILDGLAGQGKLDVAEIRGKWETFLLTVVRQPLPGVEDALVIAGSDRRGTAFGVYDLSGQMGVSPWNWWADVPPQHRKDIFVRSGRYRQGPPSVKFRGIFLNDEDWGLRPWAGKTFDPELGDIGPKTYARVFELLLRLKANFLWPAMHGCTQAFNNYPRNKEVADEYAIVMGSSHAEPMLRNNVTEWDHKVRGEWDYETNGDGVRKYWDERAAENGKYENVFTMGMRGIHDDPMPGSGGTPDKVALLERIFRDQREILANRVNPRVAEVPQIFVPYKEVLPLYQAGLKVPEDVMLGWVDDNFGYIRQLSSPEEQKRPGGAGVYYHISYYGAPHDYLWLNTTPPALIWEEMSKAWAYNARSLWVLNVGDLKPGEIATDYFLRMAWDVTGFETENQTAFLTSWASREFGAEKAPEIARILTEYYRLGFARKPEHMGWNEDEAPVSRTEFTPIAYGDEAQRRLDACASLTARAERVFATIPDARKDAFFELVLYPVRAAGLMNQKMLDADRSFLYAVQGRRSANTWAGLARRAFVGIEEDTERYNRLAQGKWRGMMSADPRRLAVFDMPVTAAVTPVVGGAMGVAVEGHVAAMADRPARGRPEYAAQTAKWGAPAESNPDTLPEFDAATRAKHFLDIFNTGTTPFPWTASADAPWVRLSQTSGRIEEEARIWVDIDWAKAPAGETAAAAIRIGGAGSERTVKVRIFNPAGLAGGHPNAFVESAGVVAMEAGNFTRRTDRGGAGWRALPELGRAGGSVAILPVTMASIDDVGQLSERAPSLEYEFQVFHAGPARVEISAVPTYRIHPGRHLRYAVAVDGQAPVVVNLEDSGPWARNVLTDAVVGSSQCTVNAAGLHTLTVWAMDPGIVLERVVVDLGGLRPSYLGPPETRPFGWSPPVH